VTLRDNLWGEYLSEGLVSIDQSRPDFPVVRRPSFEAVRKVAGAPEDERPPASQQWDLAMLLSVIRSWWL
jgi:hypothetical protein